MSEITIPPAALEAGARAYRTQHYTVTHEDAIRAAFLAMIEAWPGAYGSPQEQILPLAQAQEDGDDGQPDEAQEWADYDPDC